MTYLTLKFFTSLTRSLFRSESKVEKKFILYRDTVQVEEFATLSQVWNYINQSDLDCKLTFDQLAQLLDQHGWYLWLFEGSMLKIEVETTIR